MNSLKITVGCLFAALFLIISCEQEEKILPPSLKLSQTELAVSAAGGQVSLDYTLENAVEGTTIAVEPVEAVDWISDIDVAVAGKITLTVAKNETEESRKAEFNVAYPGLDGEVSFAVVQEPAEPQPAPFEITVKDVQTSSITFDIIPLDKEMDYIFFVSPTEYVAGFPNDDDLFNDDMTYFESEGIALEGIIVKGDMIDHVESPVLPATAFTVYAYGIDIETKTRLTDIVREETETNEIETIDVDFKVDLNVNGAAATLTVDPGTYSGWYYVDILEGLDPEQVDMLTACYQLYLNDIALYLGMGMDPENILMVSGYKGVFTDTFNLEPEKKYTVVVFALDETPQLCSIPYYETFDTEKVEPSDNVITMETTNVTAHTATLNITTTNDDSYVWVQTDPVSFEGYTDEEILQMIVDYYPIYNVYSGDRTENLSGLNADTDYMILAFGYSGGIVTTSLFKHIFTTPEEATSDLAFQVNFDKWYSIEEVAELMPDEYGFYVGGWDCVMPMEVEADFESIDKYYYYMYDRSALSSMSDNDIKMDLMNNYSLTDPATVFIMSYGQECVIAGFAIDKNGAYTKVWRSKPFTVTEEGASHDADEFVNWYNGAFGTKALSHSTPKPNTVRVLEK